MLHIHAISSGLLCALLLTFSQCANHPSAPSASRQVADIAMNDSIWNAMHAQLDSSATPLRTAFMAGNYEWMRQWYVHWQSIVPSMAAYREDSLVRLVRIGIPASLGNMQTLTGDVENGLKNLLDGIALAEQEFGAKHPYLLDCCVGIGSNYALRGDYESAIYWQYKGIEYTQHIYPPGHPAFGKWHFNIGYYRSRQGDYAASLAHYEQAAAIYACSEYKSPLAYTYERAADAAVHLRDFTHARRLLAQGDSALAFSAGKMEHDRAILLLGKAGLALAENQPEVAQTCLKASEKDLQNVPATKSPAWSDYFTLKGDLALCTGALDTAIDCYHRAITGNYQHVVQCFVVSSQSAGFALNQELLNKIAGLYLQKGDISKALSTLQGLLNSFNAQTNAAPEENPDLDALPHSVVLISTLHLKARALEQQFKRSGSRGDLQTALAAYRLAAAFIDKLNRGLRWENSKFTLESRAVPLYESAIAFLLQLEKADKSGRYVQEAWELADRSKAVGLQEQLAGIERQQFAGQPNVLAEREKELRREIAFLEQRVVGLKSQPDGGGVPANDETNGKGAGQKLLQYQTRLLAAKNRYAALLDSMQLTKSGFYRLHYAAPPATVQQVRHKVLKDNGALIEFFAGDSSLYIFGLNASGLHYHIVPFDSTLHHQIRLVSEIATDTAQSFSDFTGAARALYQRLIAPVLPEAGSREKIIVVPDGSLAYLPFQLLLENDVNPVPEDWRDLPYLLKTAYIRYEYAAALLLDSPFDVVSGNSNPELYAGFAPAYAGIQPLVRERADSLAFRRVFPGWRGGDALPDLRFNRPEVQEAALTLGGKPYLDSQATEARFKQLAPRYRILHLAMHAWSDDADPLYSQLVFTPTPGDSTEDGSLHVYELYNMRLRAALAVLSACQTGAGKVQRGEGILSLTRAFKYAGCPNIVMSLWNADDAAAKRIMGRFFDNLKNGFGKDAALAEAQRAFLQEATKEEGHPARWATFVLIGDDAPVITPLQNWLVAGLTGLLGLGILYLFFFKRQRHPGSA